MASEHEQAASQETWRQHDEIAQAMFMFDRALAAPSPGRESSWKARVGAALAVVVDLIRQHVEAAESNNGLIAQLEVAQGHNRDARLACEDHVRMIEAAERLLADLSDGEGVDVADVRERTAELANMLRAHRWREADLIMAVFGLDVGTGD